MVDSEFEVTLARQLRRLADTRVRAVDPVRTAEAVIADTGHRRPWLPELSFGAKPALRMLWIAALLLLLLAAMAAAITGALPRILPSTPAEQLAVVRGGELYVSSGDQGNLVRISGLGDILGWQDPAPDIKAAFWSPDDRYIAVALGQGSSDPLWHGAAWLTSDGSVLGTLDLAANLAWKPDSQGLVILPLDPSQGFDATVVGLNAVDQSTGSITLPAGGRSLKVPQPGIPFAFGWYPTGRAIVSVRNVALVGSGFEPDANHAVSNWLADPSGDLVAKPIGGLHDATYDIAAAVRPNGLGMAVLSGDPTRQPAVILRTVALNGQDMCTQPLDSGNLHGAFDGNASVAWDADGSRIAVSIARDDGSELWLAQADCADPPALLVDGTTTASVTEEDSSLAASESPLRVVAGEAVTGPIQWSHDGRWIYYRGLPLADQLGSGFEHFDLRRIAVDGGVSELVAPAVEWFDLGEP